MIRLTHSIAIIAVLLLAFSAQAADEKVYDGITLAELVAFAKREGWQTEPLDTAGSGAVTISVSGPRIRIEMLDCDDTGRCGGGLIRDLTYYFLKPTANGFWHWNLSMQGATGFGPSYITLQRYLHFRGVTDRYLRDVIGTIWPRAAKSFWDEVKERYEHERGGTNDDAPDKD